MKRLTARRYHEVTNPQQICAHRTPDRIDHVLSRFYILDCKIAGAISTRLQVNQPVQGLVYFRQLQILRKGSLLQVIYFFAQIQEFANAIKLYSLDPSSHRVSCPPCVVAAKHCEPCRDH